MVLHHFYLINPEPGKLLVNYKANGIVNHVKINGYEVFDMYNLHPGFSYSTDIITPALIQNIIITKFFGDSYLDPVILNLNPNPYTGEIRGRDFFDYVQMPSIPVSSKSFVLTYDFEAKVPIKTLGQWNNFFGTTTITSFSQNGTVLTFNGGTNITIPPSAFKNDIDVVSIVDTTGSIIAVGTNCFEGCLSLDTVNLTEAETISGSAFFGCRAISTITLSKAKTIGNSCFYNCNHGFDLYIPVCEHLGGTVYTDDVFHGISGKIVNITLPHAIMVCNFGAQDGDITELQAAGNMVTITET